MTTEPLPDQSIEVVRAVDGRLLGSIAADRNFPDTFVNVRDACDNHLRGTPFGVMASHDLRAWAAAFGNVADALDEKEARRE